MKKLTNPEAFRFESAVILSALFEAFPSLADWVPDDDIEFYPTSAGKSRSDIQIETIDWLRQNGYVHVEFGFVGGNWKGLRLTDRTLRSLEAEQSTNSGPASSRAQVIKKALGKGAVDVVASVIAKVIVEFSTK